MLEIVRCKIKLIMYVKIDKVENLLYDLNVDLKKKFNLDIYQYCKIYLFIGNYFKDVVFLLKIFVVKW